MKPQNPPTANQISHVRQYIKHTWQKLTRGHADLLNAAQDPKADESEQEQLIIYISQKEDAQNIRKILSKENPQDFDKIAIKQLPDNILDIETHGLLYQPGEYVVPGGRFNEVYGWDSYFILLGLLQDNEQALAHSLTHQLLYQVEHYGAVLNANRTYYLTRSHPPLLSRMVLELYTHTQDSDDLLKALPALITYYDYWLQPEHLDKESGLSRYWDFGNGPAPEVVSGECDDQGRTHFDRVKEFYRENKVEAYDLSLYYDAERDELTELFYKGDRTMRESGFDPTHRFGPFSVDIIHYLPVCLNSLLYQMEQDIVTIYTHLAEHSSQEQQPQFQAERQRWQSRAQQRQRSINQYLWDEEQGLYLDYHLTTRQRRHYPYATTFYPLWTGLASSAQAQRVVDNLPTFEAPGGVRTSTYTSGNQWDDPFGWAPLQLIAVEGLQRYGNNKSATRLARQFVSLVIEDFERTGSIVEKYDLNARSSEVSQGIQYGYSSNEIGFGWTNGVVLALLKFLEESDS